MRRKLIYIGLLLLALIVCYPFIFILTGSLMAESESKEYLLPMITGMGDYASWRILPMVPTLKHYVELLIDSPGFFLMFWNSFKITGCVLIGQLIVGVSAAWALAKLKLPFKKILFMVYIVLMMMPFQVTMLSNYLVLDKLKLMDTHAAIILPAVFSTFPVFIMHRFFVGVPDGIIEAAKIDGAGDIKTFIHVGIPLGSGGIISAVVLSFLECWNLIEQPLTFLKTKSLWPLSLYLPNISLERTGYAFTASVMAFIPALLLFLSGQDYLEKGIVASALKE